MTDLHTALAAFQDAMPTVPKNRTARTPSGYTYRYADLTDVTNAARPVLAEHGLVFYTAPGFTDTGAPYITGFLVHIASGEWLEGHLPLQGRHPQDMGSAITYARRYLLGCLTGLLTEDDDDAGATAPAVDDRAVVVEDGTDREAAVDAALADATTVKELGRVYAAHAIGTAPESVKAKYFARLTEVQGVGA